MKKSLFKKISLLLFMLFVPCTLLLCACGPTPTNEARSVRFVSNVSQYETGSDGVSRAIFEVDLNVPTHLDFTVTPSSWSGYEQTYRIRSGNYGANLNRFKLEDGIITIINSDFEPIDIEIRINDHIDMCQVRLKVYPNEIFYKGHQTNFTINSSEMLQITPFAKFGSSSEEVELDEMNYHYKYLVETSNPTLIEVPNPNVLKVCATQKVPNELVTVQVYMLNQKGEKIIGLSFSMKFTIIQLAKDGYLKIDGVNTLIYGSDAEPLELDAETFLVDEGNYQMNYVFRVISENNVMIEDFDYRVECTNADCSQKGVIKFTQLGGEKLDIKLSIYCTGLYTSQMNTYKFIVNFKIKF